MRIRLLDDNLPARLNELAGIHGAGTLRRMPAGAAHGPQKREAVRPGFGGYYTVHSYSFLCPGAIALTRQGSFTFPLGRNASPATTTPAPARFVGLRTMPAPEGPNPDAGKSYPKRVIFSGFQRPCDSSDKFHKKSHLVSVPLLYISQPFISRASISKRLPHDENMSDGCRSSQPATTFWGYACAYWWWRTIPFKPRKYKTRLRPSVI